MINNIIKETAIDIAGLPKEVVAEVAKFKTHYVVLVDGTTKVNGSFFALPGNMALIDSKNNYFNIFGIETPETKVLVVIDKTINGAITKEDLEFFKDLDQFSIVCNMRNLELEPDEVFRPIDTLLNSEISSDNGSYVEIKSAVNGRSIYVKKDSNRYKFIRGESDFFDDPFDFYATKDMSIRIDNIEHYAGIKGENSYTYLVQRFETNPLGACLTLFENKNMKEIASKAIDIRTRVNCKIEEDSYWNDFIEPSPRLSTYSEIDWKLVEKNLVKAKNNEEDFNDIVYSLAVEADSSNWGPYTVHVFFMFFMLLEQERVDYIKSAFNL